jgi:propanediol utilization protein
VNGEKLVSRRGEKIAISEQFKLEVDPHIRASGDIAGTPGCTLESGQVCLTG